MSTQVEQPTLPVATGAETRREVWRATSGHRRQLGAVVLLGLVSSALGLVMPALLGQLVDDVRADAAGTGRALGIIALAGAAAVLGAIGTALTTLLAARVYHAVLADLRERLVDRALHLPQQVVERSGTGDLVARTSDDVAEIADAAPELIPAFTAASFTIVVTLGGMSALDWRYGVAMLVVVPVYALTLPWYLSTAPPIYQQERAAMSGRAQHILESLKGFETIRGLGLRDRHHQRVTDASWTVVHHSLRTRTVVNMFLGRLHLAEYLALVAVLAVGYWMIGAGATTLGAATAAMLFVFRIFGPIGRLLLVVDELQSALASLRRIVGVCALPARGPEHAGGSDGAQATLPSGESDGAVRLHRVSFAYDGTDRPALREIDLEIAAGSHVAVVGASGAGKTTLAAVISGIHHPQHGSVTRPARTVTIAQEPHIFGGSLRDNLMLGAPEATDPQIIEALEATGASTLLERLERGLDHPLGSAGHELTAAQAQLVALARVRLTDPELAIFDEATAEAGSTHADRLDAAAEAALRGRTGLVIAHRLSQAATCDRVLVMDAGRIVQDGRHEDLVAADGTYARLWRAWLRSAPDRDGAAQLSSSSSTNSISSSSKSRSSSSSSMSSSSPE